jgi:hypothetical protein
MRQFVFDQKDAWIRGHPEWQFKCPTIGEAYWYRNGPYLYVIHLQGLTIFSSENWKSK